MRHGADLHEIRAVAAASAGPTDPRILACEQITDVLFSSRDEVPGSRRRTTAEDG